MVDEQHHYRTDDRHEHAVDIEAGDAFCPELGEQKAANDRADDPQHNVEDHPFARLVDDLAANEASNSDPKQASR
jgi:hypothetical protein